VIRVDLRTSSTILGSNSSLSFNKAVVDASWYFKGIGSGIVALRLRGGLIGGGAATGGARLPPPEERLYAGGETSVRGYSQNELGPLIYVTDDTTGLGAAGSGADRLESLRMRVIPTGGNTMYVGNAEYRIRGPFFSTIQTILFADVGQLWSREITEVGQGPKWTPGVAFRYFSPFGPIQINIGYNRYPRPQGPVFYDAGISSTGAAPLVCLSGLDVDGNCAPANALRPPNSFLKRLKLSIAFPPDF
jgi:outer membrane protein insertion porin family/translocation and assembly module TamA